MAMQKEKVVVLLSSYNGEKYIEQQIQSILQQDIDCDLTLVIRDDGSSDNTVGIIKEKQAHDNRLILLVEKNIGLNRSYFELLKYAHDNFPGCRYFALSDQDDVWDPEKIQVGVNKIREIGNQPALYGSASRPVDQNLNPLESKRKILRPITFYNSIIQNFIAGHTFVFNHELLDLVYKADATRMHGHDSFILNVALLSGTLVYDENSYVNYRQHSNNQLGTANRGIISWIAERLKRIKKGDAVQYGRQIEYIDEYCANMMTVEQKEEVDNMLQSRKSFVTRLGYVFTRKVYRQERFDDFAFCLLYLMGGYNT